MGNLKYMNLSIETQLIENGHGTVVLQDIYPLSWAVTKLRHGLPLYIYLTHAIRYFCGNGGYSCRCISQNVCLQFPCLLGSGGGVGGERQWQIARHQWRFTSL